MKKQNSHDPTETFNIAKDLASQIHSPVLIGLTGELGTGKTVFAKGFAEGLKVKELVTSPTFLGICEYYSGNVPFIHMDFYKKVVSKKDIDSYLKKDSVVLIEWFENFSSVFNEDIKPDICVYIQYVKDKEGNLSNSERQISIEVRSQDA